MRLFAILSIALSLPVAANESGGIPVSQSQSQQVTVNQTLMPDGASLFSEGALQQTVTEGDVSLEAGDMSVQFDDTLQRYNNPNIWMNIPNPTAPCMGSAGIGGSGGGLGLSLGGTREDQECTARETARMFANMGQGQFALRILCQTKAVKRAGLAAECPTDWTPPEDKPKTINVSVTEHCDERCMRQQQYK